MKEFLLWIDMMLLLSSFVFVLASMLILILKHNCMMSIAYSVLGAVCFAMSYVMIKDDKDA